MALIRLEVRYSHTALCLCAILVRCAHLQELCPFPAPEIRHVLARYPRAQRMLLLLLPTPLPLPTVSSHLHSHLLLCAEFLWAQEEHRNAGAWAFVRPRFRNLLGLQVCRLPSAHNGHLSLACCPPHLLLRVDYTSTCPVQLRYAGRDECAAPAVAIGDVHRAEADLCLSAPFAPLDSLPM